jgi:hypothetical protein
LVTAGHAREAIDGTPPNFRDNVAGEGSGTGSFGERESGPSSVRGEVEVPTGVTNGSQVELGYRFDAAEDPGSTGKGQQGSTGQGAERDRCPLTGSGDVNRRHHLFEQ